MGLLFTERQVGGMFKDVLPWNDATSRAILGFVELGPVVEIRFAGYVGL